MKLLFSILLSIAFLCQTYALSKVDPMLCKKEEKVVFGGEKITKHSCCLVKIDNQKSSDNKNNCGSELNKGCCCTAVLAIPLETQVFYFIKPTLNKEVFGYQFSFSEYSNFIFHPPVVA